MKSFMKLISIVFWIAVFVVASVLKTKYGVPALIVVGIVVFGAVFGYFERLIEEE